MRTARPLPRGASFRACCNVRLASTYLEETSGRASVSTRTGRWETAECAHVLRPVTLQRASWLQESMNILNRDIYETSA